MEYLLQKQRDLKNRIKERDRVLKEVQKEQKDDKKELNNTEKEIGRLEDGYKQKESDNEITEDDENVPGNENGKRKRMEEFVNERMNCEKRGKRRKEKFEAELINGEIDEETEEKAEEVGLIHLYIKSVKQEDKKNRETILYWNNFTEEYQERIMKKIEDEKETIEMTELMAARRVNNEMRKELPEKYKKELNRNIEAARKARYIIQELGIERIGKMSMDTLRNTGWNIIKGKVYEEHTENNGGKIVEV